MIISIFYFPDPNDLLMCGACDTHGSIRDTFRTCFLHQERIALLCTWETMRSAGADGLMGPTEEIKVDDSQLKGCNRQWRRFISWYHHQSVQFRSVAQSCPTLCNPMDCSMPGFPVHHQLSAITQTHVHWVGDAIQPSHPLSAPSPPTFNHSQHQGLFQWVSSSHDVAKVLEFQLQHQPFQWIFRTNFL